MKKVLIGALAIAAALATSTSAYAADAVTLQLKWVAQAQFTGYFVAKSKGFYKDENLDVTIKAGGPDISPVQVLAGGWRRYYRRLDGRCARVARKGRQGRQYRAAVQELRPASGLAARIPASSRRPTSRARRSASGSTATNIRSSPGCRSLASRPRAAPTASPC